MKVFKFHNTKSDLSRNKAHLSIFPLLKKEDQSEFDFSLEEFLKEETRECDEYPVLLPRRGRFWDNGYEDIE